MAISIRGSAGSYVNGTTQTLTPVLPTHAAGDMLIVRAAAKPATGLAPSTLTLTCSTSDWAAVGTQYQNGTTVSANGGGSLAFQAFYKIATSAAETDPVVDFGAATSPGMAVAVVYQKASTETWVTPTGAGGGDSTARTSQTCTIGSHISTTAGDMVDFFLAWCDNYASTNPTFTQTSVTYGTVAEQPATALSTGSGNDGAMDGGYRLASSGTSSAAAVVTATFGNSEQGGAWTTRLRVYVATSATQQATAVGTGAAYASGKTVKGTTGAAAGTGAAYQAAGRPGARPTTTLATGAGAAYAVTAKTKALTTLATATGAANASGKTVKATAGVGAGTGAALVAVGRTGERAPAELAAATGSAYGATAKVVGRLAAATATGAAQAASAKVGATAVVAAATGTALDVTAQTSAGMINFTCEAAATGTALALAINANLKASAGYAKGRSA